MEDRACQGSKLRCEWNQIGITQLMSDPQIYHGISEPWSPQKKGVTGPGSPSLLVPDTWKKTPQIIP